MRPDPRHRPGVTGSLPEDHGGLGGFGQPQRVRAFHVTDHDITTLARRFRRPTSRASSTRCG
ncbi:hypothetical protein MAHJHV57_51640 [Mycobacterium avium subsp. hominissuis]